MPPECLRVYGGFPPALHRLVPAPGRRRGGGSGSGDSSGVHSSGGGISGGGISGDGGSGGGGSAGGRHIDSGGRRRAWEQQLEAYTIYVA